LEAVSGSVAAEVAALTVPVTSEVSLPPCELCSEEPDGQVPVDSEVLLLESAELVPVEGDVSAALPVSGLELDAVESEEPDVVEVPVAASVPVAGVELPAGLSLHVLEQPEAELVAPDGVDVVWGSRRSLTGEKKATSTFAISEPPLRGAVTTSATNETGVSLASGPSSHCPVPR
jgi:hypothetical protein